VTLKHPKAASGPSADLAPAHIFAYTVPWLIAGSCAAVLLPRRTPSETPRRWHRPLLLIGTALIGIYSGYFGAAAGVLMLALLLAMTDDSLKVGNAAKNLLVGASNAIAAVAFALFGPVRWSVMAPLGAGLPPGTIGARA